MRSIYLKLQPVRIEERDPARRRLVMPDEERSVARSGLGMAILSMVI
jgi:hypothetical protein